MKNKVKKIIDNVNVMLVMNILIVISALGFTYSLVIGAMNTININTSAIPINANITYDTGSNSDVIINNGNMLPIDDDLVTGPDVTDVRVLKAKFIVSGSNDNPDNTIYDIALHNTDIDCELRTEDLKWRLYKENELISSGNLSPTFDTIANNRLVLTNTQEDLKSTPVKYTFILWISEKCSGDIGECTSDMDQSDYLNKNLSANIKVELSTKSKKKLVRITGSSDSCNYIPISVPVCNELVYNGGVQTLVNSGSNYKVGDNTGTYAGTYAVTVKLNDGYKWSNGETSDKVLKCNIDKKEVVVTTLDQNIVYGSKISSTVNDVTVSALISGDSVSSVSLNSSIVEVGEGIISTSGITIDNGESKNVTSNYNIKKNNTGKVIISCANIAEEPSVNDYEYNGSEFVGVSGGKYIDIFGTTKSSFAGLYKVSVVPMKNYCWSDGTTSKKEYTWKIINNQMSIKLFDKTVVYTGNGIEIDEAVVNDIYGNVVDLELNYKYYSGNSCNGSSLDGLPTFVGTYSVKAYATDNDKYGNIESNCAVLNIVKKNSSLTVSNDNLSIVYPNNGSFSYSYDGDGKIICSSSNVNVAKCQVDSVNNKVTVIPVSAGNTNIVLSASNGNNYNDNSKNVNIKVTYDEYKINLNNNSATSGGTTYLYGRYANGIFLDSDYTKNMTVSSNGIVVPVKTGYTFSGYYTLNNGSGKKLIDVNGYITDEFTNVLYSDDVTLYAKWTPNGYSVSFDGNGATSGTMSNQSFTYDVAQNLTANAFKRAYTVTYNYNGSGVTNSTVTINATFNGWAESSTGAKVYNDKASVKNLVTSGTKNLYANWTLNEVTLPTPTRAGYTFTGWYTAASGGSKVGAGGATYTPSANITLYAQWTSNGYSVSFDGNGATSGTMSNQSFTYDVAQNLTANAFKRAYTVTYNYNGNGTANGTGTATSTFNGWAESSTGAKVYNDKASVNNLVTSGTKTLYANWTLGSVTLPTPTRAGYTFTGWYTAASGGSKVGVGGATYTPSANITLYAQWQVVKYSITYNLNGGTVATANPAEYTVETATFTLNNPTRTGYTFNGWTGTGLSSASTSVAISKGSTGNRSYTANWTINTYTISYDANGGSGAPSSQTKTHGVSLTLSEEMPIRTGYNFLGWSTDKSATSATYGVSGTYTLNGNATLYAIWGRNTYTISYDFAAGLPSGYKLLSYIQSSGTQYIDTGYKPTSENLRVYIEFSQTASASGQSLFGSEDNKTSSSRQWSTVAHGGAGSFSNYVGNSGSLLATTAAVGTIHHYQTHAYNGTLTVTNNGNLKSGTYNGNLLKTYNILIFANNIDGKAGQLAKIRLYGFKIYDNNVLVRNMIPCLNASGTAGLYDAVDGKFYANAGTGTFTASETYPTSYNVESSAISIPNPLRVGYTFNGWTGSNGSTASKSVSIAKGSSGNKSYTANWTANTYSVAFNGNGSTSGTMSNQSFIYDVAQNLTANAFKRAYTVTYNYNGNGTANSTGTATSTFNGWAESSTGAKVYNDKASVKNLVASGTKTLYANWTLGSVTLPTPTRTGYTFAGWYTAASGGSKVGAGGATYTPSANITLYAQWSPTKYTINYHANGGSGTVNSQTATFDSDITIAANAFTRTGYTFAGWSTKTDNTNDGYGWTGWSGKWVFINGEYGISNNTLNLYARWTPIKYSITYNLNGGTVATANPADYTIETATFTLNNPTRTGYTFNGWTGSNGSTASKSVSIAKGSTGNKTYTANWTADTYTINYSGGGGSGSVASQSFKFDSQVAIASNAFSLRGHNFAGWTTRSDNTDDGYGWTGWSGKWVYANGKYGISNNTLNLIARWSPKSYTISYNANGGTGTMSSHSVSYNGSCTIKDNTFTRENYNFVGWTTRTDNTSDGYGWSRSDGSGWNGTWKYVDGEYGIANGELKLYAIWTPVKYSITYNLNGGTVATANPAEYTVETATFTLNNPTRSGYTFNGWTGTGLSSASTSVAISKGSTGNRSYTANWTANTYTISYDANGGSGAPSSQTKTHGVTLILSDVVPTRAGYNFLGWSTDKSATSATYNVKGEYTSNKSITLYAVWSVPLVDYINFLYDDSTKSVVVNNEIDYRYATSVNLMNDRHDSSGNLLDELDGGNIRYYGADPNNYIYFNCDDYSNQSSSTCELWRIIGLFKDITLSDGTKKDLIKIVHSNVADSVKWNENTEANRNNWYNASLQISLNGTYYNGTDISGLKGITGATQNRIENVIWNLGNNNSVGDFPNVSYTGERSDVVYTGNQATWPGKIALMYPSDYGYATDFSSCNVEQVNYSTDTDCTEKDWLFKKDYKQFLLTPAKSSGNTASCILAAGEVRDNFTCSVFNPFFARPTLFLNSDEILIDGMGTSSEPYRIRV